MNSIITDDILEDIGFERQPTPGHPYGKAISLRPKGKRIISWNEDGFSMDYFGNRLDKNVYVVIEEDAGTRTVFAGVIYSINDLKLILSLVQ